MANSYGEILTARGGSYILNTTDSYDRQVYAIVTLEDTRFTSLDTIDSNGIITGVLSDHFADPNIDIKAGAIITPIDINKPFINIQLSTGSVALILK